MLFYGVIIPLLNTILEYIETKKEVFVSNHNVIIAQNNLKIQKMQLDSGQNSLSAIGFENPSTDEYDECDEDNYIEENRKVGF